MNQAGDGSVRVAAGDLVAVDSLAGNALDVAPFLLNKVLVHGATSGRIVEVEAYRGTDDPASHAWRGPTPRTEVMFGPPGNAYVYFSYGMHWCTNIVVEPEGSPAAVLVRALAPLTGLDEMTARRPAARRVRDLCNGPAKASAALGIDGTCDGASLAGNSLRLVDDGVGPPGQPNTTTRIGISRGVDLPWRFCVPDDPNVSR